MERSDTDNRVGDAPSLRSVPEEVNKLLAELAEQKASLQAIASRMGSMEKHIRRAFDIPKARKQQPANPSPRRQKSALLDADLLAMFENYRALWLADREDEVRSHLKHLPAEDLRALATELGIPAGTNTPRGRLISGVTGKLKESQLLGSNRTIAIIPPDSGEIATDDRKSDQA